MKHEHFDWKDLHNKEYTAVVATDWNEDLMRDYTVVFLYNKETKESYLIHAGWEDEE